MKNKTHSIWNCGNLNADVVPQTRSIRNKCGAVYNNLNGCANVQRWVFGVPRIKSIYIHFLQLVKK